MSEARGLRRVFHQWGGSVSALFAYAHAAHDGSGGLLQALLPLIRTGLGLAYLETGLVLTAYSIISSVSQFLGGWLSDRINRYIVAAIGLAFISLGCLGIGLSPGYYVLLAVLFIKGIFAGAYHPSATPLLSGYFEEARRGKVISVHLMGGSVGMAVFPIVGGFMAQALGYRLTFVIMAIPAFVALLLILNKFRQERRTGGGDPVSRASTTDGALAKPKHRWAEIGQVLRPVAVITSLCVLTQFFAGSAQAYLSLYLVDKLNIAPGYAAMLVGIMRSGGIIGSLFGGWLSDRWGRQNATYLVVVATGPILLLLAQLPFNAAFIVVLILFGLFYFMRQATIQPLLMDATPPYLRSTVFGIYFGISMEGQSLLMAPIGYFMDIFGIVPVFQVVALTTVALSVIALILAVRPKSRRRLPNLGAKR